MFLGMLHTPGMEIQGVNAKRADRTRTRLLRAATSLFGKRGYEATRLEAVAEAAGVTKGAIYHQFRDKRELFESVVERCVADVVRATKAHSRQRAEGLGHDSHSWARSLAAMEILLQAFSNPVTRRLLLIEAPAVLGRVRWQEIWGGEKMLGLARGLPYDAFRRGHLPADLVEPAAHLFLGAVQEAALAIGHSEDAEAARARFQATGRWLLESVLRPTAEELASEAAERGGSDRLAGS